MDSSRQIYELQKGNRFRSATFYLTDGRIVEGVIVAYCLGEVDAGETYIVMWHFVPEEIAQNGGWDFLGFMEGDMIYHYHVDKVVFEDGTTIYNQ